MTRVYYTYCKQLPQSDFEKMVSSLPERMQKRLRRFKRWQDAHAYLYGRLLLKEGMLQLGYHAPLESLKETKYGKPYFADNSFSFNISHSEDYVVCVISNDEKAHIGIDIEKVKPISLEDFKCVFTPKESREIDNYVKFYTCWTRKEAVVKADGRGLMIPLNTIDATGLSVKLEHDYYYLYKVDIDDDYIMHIASLTKIEKTSEINCLLKAAILGHSQLVEDV